MGIQLDKTAYQKLIDENIEALNKYMPEHSLEKKHTIEVLKWSVSQIYGAVGKNVDTSEGQLTIPDVSVSLPDANPHICPECGWQCTCSDQPCSCCNER